MHEEKICEIALSLLYRNRLRAALALLDTYGTASEVWKHLGEKGMAAAWDAAEEEMEFVVQHRIGVVSCLDSAYPRRLRECPDRPLVLYSKGNVRPNEGKFVSVVGTRMASDRGKELTRQLVLDLAQLVPDVTIVSGLAYGIDIAAHRAALEAGIPTLIVPAHGLDRIYPSVHRSVAVQALESGGILTEYPCGTPPERQNFLARNRIVAGLADAVVCVESKQKGGSLVTAQMALDYNRDLFAFPGRPTDDNARGCNDLIRRQKAALIESAADLVYAMQWDVAPSCRTTQGEIPGLFSSVGSSVGNAVSLHASLSPVQRTLLDKLHEQEDGLHINVVVMETGLPYSDVSSELMMMEMQGLVKSLPGGIFRALK